MGEEKIPNKQQTETSLSYWDWPSGNNDDSSCSNDFSSVSNMQANLIADANDSRGKPDVNAVHSNTENYREGEVEENPEKSRLIDLIMEEERLRNMLSIQHVELVEQRSAAKRHIASSCQTEGNEICRRYGDNTTDSESYW